MSSAKSRSSNTEVNFYHIPILLPSAPATEVYSVTENTLMIHRHFDHLFSFSYRQRSKPITHDQFLKHKFGKFR